MHILMKHYSLTVSRIGASFSCISSLNFFGISELSEAHSLPGSNQVASWCWNLFVQLVLRYFKFILLNARLC